MSLPTQELDILPTQELVAIEVLSDNVVDDDNIFLSGDIVLQFDVYRPTFLRGKRGLFDQLHEFHESGKSTVIIKVKRGERVLTREAFIAPERNPDHVLMDYYITSHIFTFEHYTEEECKALQGQAQERMHKRLLDMRVASADVHYLWENDLSTSVEGFNMMYSILVLPHKNSIVSGLSSPEETVYRAMTWFNASRVSGVPLTLRNVQTEPLLTEASGQGSDAYFSSIGNTGTYGIHQSRGATDDCVVNIVRAVRLWFEFEFAEVKVYLVPRQDQPLLGVSIGRTIEGFCYVTNVGANTAAHEAGLKGLLDNAKKREMRLVVTRVGKEKVLPWFIANDTIKCYDVSSITSMLKAYRLAQQPACLYVLDINSPTLSQSPMHIPTLLSTDSFGIS